MTFPQRSRRPSGSARPRKKISRRLSPGGSCVIQPVTFSVFLITSRTTCPSTWMPDLPQPTTAAPGTGGPGRGPGSGQACLACAFVVGMARFELAASCSQSGWCGRTTFRNLVAIRTTLSQDVRYGLSVFACVVAQLVTQAPGARGRPRREGISAPAGADCVGHACPGYPVGHFVLTCGLPAPCHRRASRRPADYEPSVRRPGRGGSVLGRAFVLSRTSAYGGELQARTATTAGRILRAAWQHEAQRRHLRGESVPSLPSCREAPAPQ